MSKNSIRPIRNLGELAAILTEKPTMKIAHLTVNEQGDLFYTKNRLGKRCWLLRNRAKDADMQRFNNWKVGVAVNALCANPHAARPYDQARALFYKNKLGETIIRSGNALESVFQTTPSMVMLATICEAVRNRELPYFETKKYRQAMQDIIVNYYNELLVDGERRQYQWVDNDLFLGYSKDQQLSKPLHSSSIADFTQVNWTDGTNPLIGSVFPPKEKTAEDNANDFLHVLEEHIADRLKERPGTGKPVLAAGEYVDTEFGGDWAKAEWLLEDLEETVENNHG